MKPRRGFRCDLNRFSIDMCALTGKRAGDMWAGDMWAGDMWGRHAGLPLRRYLVGADLCVCPRLPPVCPPSGKIAE
jgi:hypothetical protein